MPVPIHAAPDHRGRIFSVSQFDIFQWIYLGRDLIRTRLGGLLIGPVSPYSVPWKGAEQGSLGQFWTGQGSVK